MSSGIPFAPLARFRGAILPRSAGSTVLPTPAAPSAPTTPTPTSGTMKMYRALRWLAAGATKFDVYLDTNPTPTTLVSIHQVDVFYVPTVLPSTTYYWQVIAINDGGQTAGPIWSFTTPYAAQRFITLAGALTSHVRADQLSIRDVLGAASNTARAIFDTSAPECGESVLVGLASLDPDDLLFGGEIQFLDDSYVDTAANELWPATLIDRSFEINKRRPIGAYANVSASFVTKDLVAKFAPSFTTTHVVDALPAISISFDGTQSFTACLQAIATAINGYQRVDYGRDVWMYLTDTSSAPDPVDSGHPPLNDPTPITFTTDLSQARTRILVKGAGSTAPTALAIGETIVPVVDATVFNATGGQAILGPLVQIVTYAGVQTAGGGSLVGPGAAPSTALTVGIAVGTGLSVGVYEYGYTDVTAAGESLPSPLATITTAVLPGPSTAPTAGTPSGGGNIDAGTHDYAVTFTVPGGETTPSPVSNVVTTATVSPPPAPSATTFLGGGDYKYAVTYVTAIGETIPGATFDTAPFLGTGHPLHFSTGTVGLVTGRKIYRTTAGGSQLKLVAVINDNSTTTFDDTVADGALGANAPTSNTASTQTVAVSNIPVGPSGVTQRKLYRTAAGGSQLNLVTTIADNTTTTYTDTLADASLGVNAPGSNTAVAHQVAVTNIAAGATSVTQRKLYRTAVGGSQLKLLTTIADNTTTTYTDSTPDGSLGANAPTNDTSGLTQPAGQVNAGSTSLLLASAGPFQANGGWATLGSSLAVRYTGVSGNTLTGIPASGPGSIQTTVVYGSQALPAPALTGINDSNGLSVAAAKGSTVNLWVQYDDLGAQAALGQLRKDDNGNPTDGVVDNSLTDTTNFTSIALCVAGAQAELAILGGPIVSVSYYTRDPKTRSGKAVHIDTGAFGPPAGDYVIQDVTITFDGPLLMPRYAVKASSVKFSLEDLLRRVALTG